MLREEKEVWEGLVSVTYMDEEEEEGKEREEEREGERGEEGEKEKKKKKKKKTVQERLLSLLEAKTREQTDGKVALSAYRIGGVAAAADAAAGGADQKEEDGQKEEERKWALAKHLHFASSPDELLECVRMKDNEEIMDATHWATALTRMSRLILHTHRHKHKHSPQKSEGKGTTTINKKKGSNKKAEWRRAMIDVDDGLLTNHTQSVTLLEHASFPAMAMLLDVLSEYFMSDENEEEEEGGGRRGGEAVEEIITTAMARVSSLLSSSSASSILQDTITTPHLVTFLHAFSKLFLTQQRHPPTHTHTPTHLPTPFFTLLTHKADQNQLDALALTSILDSLAHILLLTHTHTHTHPQTTTTANDTDSRAAAAMHLHTHTHTYTTHTCLSSLLHSAESKLHLLKAKDLVLFVRAMSLLHQPHTHTHTPTHPHTHTPLLPPPQETLITAIVEAAGKPQISQSLSLADLALLTFREPGAAAGGGSGAAAANVCMSMSMSMSHEEENGGSGGAGGRYMVHQRERRKTPQWPLVAEVRRRLRALSPSGLVLFLLEMGDGGGGGKKAKMKTFNTHTHTHMDKPTMEMLSVLPTRAFLIMLTNELYKQRGNLNAREKAAVIAQLKKWKGVHDPGSRFWGRFPRG